MTAITRDIGNSMHRTMLEISNKKLLPSEARRLTRRGAWVTIKIVRDGKFVFREGPIDARLDDQLCRVVFVGCFAYLYSEIKSWEEIGRGK